MSCTFIFGEPQPADDSDITDEGVIIRLREGKIVGLSILNAREKIYGHIAAASAPRAPASRT